MANEVSQNVNGRLSTNKKFHQLIEERYELIYFLHKKEKTSI